MIGALPVNWTIIAPWTHPRDGEPGVVISPDSGGPEWLYCVDGSLRSLPWRWREHPPDPCGLAIARALAGRLGWKGFGGHPAPVTAGASGC